MQGQLVEDPHLGMRHRFRADGDDLWVETWVDPGGGVSPHVHPRMTETFEVLEGAAEVLSGRRWEPCAAGASVVVPPGTRHAFRNRSGAELHIRCLASPGLTLQTFLEDAAAMGRAGLLGPLNLPKGPKALLQAAVLIDANLDMAVLGPPLPPAPVQRALFPRLARAARKRGYEPGRLGDRA